MSDIKLNFCTKKTDCCDHHICSGPLHIKELGKKMRVCLRPDPLSIGFKLCKNKKNGCKC